MTPKELKEIRRKLKMTQAELAADLCVTVTTVANWEQGKTISKAMEQLINIKYNREEQK
jgi:DNA-binding transcriptional regulator YiaG